jgi:hypothetical protein
MTHTPHILNVAVIGCGEAAQTIHASVEDEGNQPIS